MASISVALSGTSSATVSTQSLLNQTRLAQARQEADQAEQNARQLRNKAEQADQQAQHWRSEAQSLSAKIVQANANAMAASQPTYSTPAKAAQAQVPPQTQDFLVRLYKATSSKFAAAGNALTSSTSSTPVINAQGQTTGRILNLAA